MASFWREYPGVTGLMPEKVVGGMSVRRAQREFPRFVTNQALVHKGKIGWMTAHHAIVLTPKGERFGYTLELISPPSAPEPYQPKRLDGGVPLLKGEALPQGIVINSNGAHKVGATIEGI